MERPAPFISRVCLKNYRSIADCDVRLGRLTVLVGPNGSGKSNFLQALALLSRAVNTTPYEAITAFGGLEEILRRAPEPAESLSIDVEATVPLSPGSEQLGPARYGFEVGIASRRGLRSFEVLRESCELAFGGRTWSFSAERGTVHTESLAESAPRIEPDRLYLPIAASQTTFGPLFQGLTNMQFYNFALDTLREPSAFSGAAVMDHRGEHFSEALGAIAGVRPEA
jgi:predicted ATPase